MNQKAEEFFQKESKWKEEYNKLREIVLECDLKEDFKWMHPCYTVNGKNVVVIHGFKEYCAILFFKGALLKDPNKILIQQTENVQSPRQVRFTNLSEIVELAPSLRSYIVEATEIEKSGKRVKLKPTADYEVPDEFSKVLEEMPELKKAFESLSPGRQRSYLFYFNSAKQSSTRRERVNRYIEKIMEGKGIND